MTKDDVGIDPEVDRPATPDPSPDSKDTAAPSRSAPSPSGASDGATEEVEEPIDNRFPEVDGGEQRESG